MMLTGPGEIDAASAKAAMDRDRLMRKIRWLEGAMIFSCWLPRVLKKSTHKNSYLNWLKVL
ncbi:hypothetical protein D3C79_1002850 [compost metagenome]